MKWHFQNIPHFSVKFKFIKLDKESNYQMQTDRDGVFFNALILPNIALDCSCFL